MVHRVAVADGWWEIVVRDGVLARGAFFVPSLKVAGGAPDVVAAWTTDVLGRAVFDGSSLDEPSVAALHTFDAYAERCRLGDWEAGIWATWQHAEAVVHTIGVASAPSRESDAILAEGARWATASIEPAAVGPATAARSAGRVTCVIANGLKWGNAAYLLVQPSEAGAEARDQAGWTIVSAITWETTAGGVVERPGGLDHPQHDGLPDPIPDDESERSAGSTAVRQTSALATRFRLAWTRSVVALPTIGFALSLAFYAFTRLWRLEDYPVYFHGDEAFQVVAARRLIEGGFKNELGVPFPFYFSNGGTWAPLVTTYLHVASTTLLGTSVTVARGTTALASVIGGAALALFARDNLRLRSWWALPLLLACVPAWFLHSRTTFETAYCVSGYATFLWCYGRYRDGKPRWGAYAVLAAAFTFYTYTNGQLIVGLTGVVLAIVDARHHWRMRKHLGWVLAPALISIVPYVMYVRAAPGATTDQLWRVSSYLVQQLTFGEKVRQFVMHYWAGLDPRYWFLPNPHELSRHAMLGYANVPTWFFPIAALGLATAIVRISRPEFRLLIVTLLATPIGASLADVGITRVLSVIVPLTLLAHVGLDGAIAQSASVLRQLAMKSPELDAWDSRGSLNWAATGAMFLWLALALPGVMLIRDAFANGPRWFTDYGLYGQQWGAVQVFREINRRAASSPEDTFFVSSTWANGTDLYLPFFVPQLQDSGRVRMGNVRDLLSVRRDLTSNMVWVMTADEVELARNSKRFKGITIDAALPYPNGSPGFSFARLEYVGNVEEVVAAERAARVALRSGQVVVNGERLAVRHSYLDAGGLPDIFDANPRTLGRFNGGNPATLEWAFPTPRSVATVALAMTAGNWHVSIAVLRPDGIVETVESDVDARSDPVTSIDVPPGIAGAIRLMITSRVHTDEAIIHLRDVTWQ